MKTSADSKNLESVKWLPADVKVLENLKELFFSGCGSAGSNAEGSPNKVRTARSKLRT